MRNYAILHIVTDEAKIFQTKERAPLLLCMEAYRPEEMLLLRQQQQKQALSLKHLKNHKLTIGDIDDKLEYDSYRSASWDSHYSASNEAEVLNPLMSQKQKQEFAKNPYAAYQKMQKQKKKHQKKNNNKGTGQGDYSVGALGDDYDRSKH
jgi:hypothetical protein